MTRPFPARMHSSRVSGVRTVPMSRPSTRALWPAAQVRHPGYDGRVHAIPTAKSTTSVASSHTMPATTVMVGSAIQFCSKSGLPAALVPPAGVVKQPRACQSLTRRDGPRHASRSA